MSNKDISQLFIKSLQTQKLESSIAKNENKILLKGLIGSSLSFLVSSIFSKNQKLTGGGSNPNTPIPMGTFTQDYEYVDGIGDLDQCNGRFGVTPEFPDGIYYYVVTDDFPFFTRCLKGNAN